MNRCRRCGKPIKYQYNLCYDCYNAMNTFKDENGYYRFKNTGKLVHRHIAEKKLGRPLRFWEIVHHINRKKTDNRASNLWVFRNQDEHDYVHWADGDFDDWDDDY